MNIYSSKDRLPYTYLIGWSQLNKFYYGRRTARGCHPEEFWKTYFTSSEYVKNFVKENGNPDIIQIRQTFDDPIDCEKWECRFLTKVNAASNPKFINEHNGGSTFSTTNKVGVMDTEGNRFLIGVTDPRYISGEFIALSKGRKASPESNAKKANGRGKVAVRNIITQECFLMDKEFYEEEKNFGVYVPVGTGRIVSDNERKLASERKRGKVTVKDSLGNIFDVSISDPRYLSGELQHISKGLLMAIDESGAIFRTTSDDPRWESGEIQNPFKGKPNLKLRGVSKPKTKCPHCNKMIANNMFKRYHGDNCKEK